MKRSGNIKKTVWRNRSIKHLQTILALLLALVLALSLAACGEEKPGTGKSKKDDDESSEKDERDDDDDEDSRGGKAYGLYVKDDELYYTDLSKNGAWQVTSDFSVGESGSAAFMLLGDSDMVTVSGDGETLFFVDEIFGDHTLCYRAASGKKDAVRIDSGVHRYYYVNDKASLVTYFKDGSLYQYDLRHDEKEKLAGDVFDFFVSDDGKRIFYLDHEDNLYQISSGGEKEKIDSDVYSAHAFSGDLKTIIYRTDGDTVYLKRDGREPVLLSPQMYDIIRIYDTGEMYYLEGDGYGTALKLYYFDGRDSEEVTDDFYYTYYDDWSVNYYPAEDTPTLVYQNTDEVYWLAAGGEATELDAGAPAGFTFSRDGKSLWYVDEPDRNNEGDLYRIGIVNGRAEKPEKVDDEVCAEHIRYTGGGRLIYFKDVSDGEGELYVDGKKADDDVLLGSVEESASGALLYFVDYSANKERGTLKQYSGGKSATVEDDVHAFSALPDGSVLYLRDYSTSKYRGDLYIYSGGKSTLLDEDVAMILSVSGGETVKDIGYY